MKDKCTETFVKYPTSEVEHAAVDPEFIREILDFSRGRYNTDRTTYLVSGNVDKVLAADVLRDADLLALFGQFDARQVLHVTFGSVLDTYGAQ